MRFLLYLGVFSLSLLSRTTANTVPLQLEEQPAVQSREPHQLDQQNTNLLGEILQVCVLIIEQDPAYAQVVENKITLSLPTYLVQIEPTAKAWKVTIEEEGPDPTPLSAYYPYRTDPVLDAKLRSYL